jgi:hypothetical protein
LHKGVAVARTELSGERRLANAARYLFSSHDRRDSSILEALNGVIADRTRAWGGVVADGFGAFGVASNFGDSCATPNRLRRRSDPAACFWTSDKDTVVIVTELREAEVKSSVSASVLAGGHS